MGLNDVHSLSHTKWNCKYHIIAEYIKNQLKEDELGEQLARSGISPLKGGK